MSAPADGQTVTYHLHQEPFTDPISAAGFQTATTGINKAPQLTIAVSAASPGVAAGNLLLAQIAIEGFGQSDVICTPGGWTLLRRDNNSSATAQAIFWRIAVASEPASYTWQFRASLASCGTNSNIRQALAVGGIIVYRGVDVSAPIFGHSAAVGSNTTMNSPAVPNAPAAARAVSFFSNNKEFAIATVGSSSAQIYTVSVPKPPSAREKPTAAAADAAHPSGGTTATVTASNGGNSANWVAQTVVLTPVNVLWRLKAAAPDNPSISIGTQNLRGKPAGDYLIREFATEPGVLNTTGTIPSGSPVSITLWMQKSSTAGAMQPRARIERYDAATQTSTPLCTALGDTMITTTLSAHTLSCTTSAHVVLTSSDRFYLWTGVNVTVAASSDVIGQLAIEGTPNGNHDSRLVIPVPVSDPTITSISPSTGVAGTSVTISGVNFGSSQGASTVAFNGVAATPTTWSAAGITVPVPTAATSGPLVVTVGGVTSNAATFNVVRNGTVAGTVTRASDGGAVADARVETFHGATLYTSGRTDSSGVYSLANIPAGTYDVRVSVVGLSTAIRAGIVVLAGMTTVTDVTLAAAATTAGPVLYAYDDFNRLIGVTDGSGASARYEYDAVGNLLSITRHATGAIAILGFSPQSGAAGTTVAISGSGFSTNASANTVTFNGVVATVITASAIELLATVPAGAASGAIAVVSPIGTATSPTPFTVLSITAAPTVTGFSPAIASIGTAVTITGSNFDPAVTNNRTRVNATFASPTAATATTVSTTIPYGATSGRVSLATPHGTAVSNDVLFIPQPPYTDVAFTSVLAVGQSLSLILGNPRQVALLALDGVAGDRIAFSITGPLANLWLFGPRGELPLDFSGALRTATLPQTGTYTLMLRRLLEGSSETTTVAVSAVPPDVAASITVDGPPVTVQLAAVGQRGRLTFSGVAGQRVGLTMTGGSAQFAKASVLDARGDVVHIDLNDSWASFSHGNFSDILLPATGLYTVLVHDASPLGTVAFKLSTFPDDVTASLAVGGSLTVATTLPGQNVRVTFAGTGGTHVALIVSNDTLQGLVTIFRPNGTTLVWPRWQFMDGTLPETGTYTILLDQYRERTGSTTLELVEPPSDLSGTINIDGAPVTITIPTAGQNARVTFTATKDQHVALVSSNNTFARVRLSVVDAANATLAAHDSINALNANLLTVVPADGVYSILIDPFGEATGEVTLAVSSLPEVTASITVGGPSVITTTASGQRVRLTFPAMSGQRISLATTGSPLRPVSVQGPTGESVPLAFTDPVEFGVLAQTGDYTVRLLALQAGNTTVRLYDVPPDVTEPILPNGSPATITLTTPGQHGRLTFDAGAGRRVSVSSSDGTFANGALTVSVIAPSGLLIGSLPGMGQGSFLDALTLPETGTYTLRLDPYASSTGTISITLHEFADVTGQLTLDGAALPVTLAPAGQNGALTFDAVAGQPITVDVNANAVGTTTVNVTRIEGSLVQSATFSGATYTLSIPSAPSTGAYRIHIDPAGTNTGTLNVKVTTTP